MPVFPAAKPNRIRPYLKPQIEAARKTGGSGRICRLAYLTLSPESVLE
jgi:hypothetical protein